MEEYGRAPYREIKSDYDMFARTMDRAIERLTKHHPNFAAQLASTILNPNNTLKGMRP